MKKITKRENYNEYMRSYMLERYHRRRNAALKQLEGKCSECDSTEGLEIDHIDRTKKSFDISRALASWSEKRVQRELDKCQLLCRGCHRSKTLRDLGRQNARKAHGTLSSYRYCRCDLCRDAKAADSKEYKRRKRAEKQTGS